MRNFKQRTALSEINVIPLVDVMLVLLLAFMIAVPLIHHGIDVDLPKARGGDMPPEERVTIAVKKGGNIYMNDNPVSMKELTKRLSVISELNPTVFLKADRSIQYGVVVGVIGEIKAVGIERLGLVTEPKAALP
ncbi:biopolymer transporter ExbD [Thermodesulfovibrionales bacterium]|nr:biopolymer transporter ExbD [Thermodesulfovibrionales bacterium]MCL0042629.1 biopolymer transporter ExbD [Thermodesulfovibrionales bacterium]MCL0046905.1 biopolymer transporter ExbD [Thermodesulfovibrionales bacterium]MCL0051302.1 biopolymer transporter ExbD [Thermodesulfovibrionales bacterium]MCL0061664.1 biopolymer transporter ExbD [Thermodesulfovibrionales bacterium]